MAAGYFDTRFAPHQHRSAVWAHIARYLQRWVDETGDVLDIGAGYGDFCRHIRAAGKVAFDIDPKLCEFVGAPIRAEIGNVTDLSRFDDSAFTTAFASNLLEHLTWDQLDRFAAEVGRILRPGGHLIAIQPNFRLDPKRYFDDYTHRTIFTDVSLRDFLVAAGFEVIHVEPRFLPLTMKSRLSWGHRLVPLYLRLPYRPLAGQMLVVVRKPALTLS